MGDQLHATEKLSLEDAKARLPVKEGHLRTILGRLIALRGPFEPGSTILDIGSAQGAYLVAAARLGWKASGVEPWEEARIIAGQFAAQEGVEIEVLEGTAESLPWPDAHFDVVVSNSVMEHVLDVEKAFSEAQRVLKPGGIFWFFTASSICPKQNEIQGYPLFGWYPNSMKLRIMEWAKLNKPELIGNTDLPAINWFTPRKARRLLQKAGFTQIYDRWDLRLPSEGGRAYRTMLRLIRLGRPTKFLADVVTPECAYAAIK